METTAFRPANRLAAVALSALMTIAMLLSVEGLADHSSAVQMAQAATPHTGA